MVSFSKAYRRHHARLADAVPIPRKAKTIVSNETGVSSFLGGSLNAVNTRTKSESLRSYVYMLRMLVVCR